MTEDSVLDLLPDDLFNEYLIFIHQITGIKIGNNRKAMLQGRFRRRIRELGLPGFLEYLELAKTSLEEKQIFINLITTNETYFLRTPRIWEYIAQKYLPNWLIQHPGQTLRVWSAAASSGEEASTLGMFCQEFQDKNKMFKYQILGTDISTEMLKLCQDGLYSGKALDLIQSTKPEFCNKFLIKKNDEYSLIQSIRSKIQFKHHNLFEKLLGFDGFDLVLLRNVLIYFTPENQERVIRNIHTSMVSDGVLIIGESESLSSLNVPFDYLAPLVYQKRYIANVKPASYGDT